MRYLTGQNMSSASDISLVNLLWINYGEICVGWKVFFFLFCFQFLTFFLVSFFLPRERNQETTTKTYPRKEIWYDVSLLKLLLHCFSPHVQYSRWQLTVRFVFRFITKVWEIKIHNKMHCQGFVMDFYCFLTWRILWKMIFNRW